MPFNRRIAWATTVFLVVCLAVIGVGVYYSRAAVLQETTVPNRTVVLQVTKRRCGFLMNPICIEVVAIGESGQSSKQTIDYQDLWQDAAERSYPLKWIDDETLAVADRFGSFNTGWTIHIQPNNSSSSIELFVVKQSTAKQGDK